jgi:hypothetical protein
MTKLTTPRPLEIANISILDTEKGLTMTDVL